MELRITAKGGDRDYAEAFLPKVLLAYALRELGRQEASGRAKAMEEYLSSKVGYKHGIRRLLAAIFGHLRSEYDGERCRITVDQNAYESGLRMIDMAKLLEFGNIEVHGLGLIASAFMAAADGSNVLFTSYELIGG